jgi:hypothetical protein
MENEIFKGKTLTSLFEDIYNNQSQKKLKITNLIVDIQKMVRGASDMAVLGVVIKDLIDISVKNDEQLIKLANLAQKMILSNGKSVGDAGFLTDEEKQQLLKDIDDAAFEINMEEDIVAKKIKTTKK